MVHLSQGRTLDAIKDELIIGVTMGVSSSINSFLRTVRIRSIKDFDLDYS